jgi:hypothetical protein
VSSGRFVVDAGVSDVDVRVEDQFSKHAVIGTIELQAAPASGCFGKDRVTWSAARGTTHPQPTQVAKTRPRLPAHRDT